MTPNATGNGNGESPSGNNFNVTYNMTAIEAEFAGSTQCQSSCKDCPLVASYCANLLKTDSLEFFVKSVSLCQCELVAQATEYVEESYVTQHHITPGIHPLYTCITIFTPMHTRYAPYIHLIHLYTPYIRPKTTH